MLDKEIFAYKNFGCIKICLDDLMNSKNISTYELSTKSGIRFQTIQSYCIHHIFDLQRIFFV